MLCPCIHQTNICAAMSCQAPLTPALHRLDHLPVFLLHHNHAGYLFACLHLIPRDSSRCGESLASCYAAYCILPPVGLCLQAEDARCAEPLCERRPPHVHPKGCSISPTGMFLRLRKLQMSRLRLTADSFLLSVSAYQTPHTKM